MRAIDAIVMTFAFDVLNKVALSILNPADRAVAVLLAGLRHFKLALFINQVFERNRYLTFFLLLNSAPGSQSGFRYMVGVPGFGLDLE